MSPASSFLCSFRAGGANGPEKRHRQVDLCRVDLYVRPRGSHVGLSPRRLWSCCKSCVPIQPCLNGEGAFLLLLLSIAIRDFFDSLETSNVPSQTRFFLITSDEAIFRAEKKRCTSPVANQQRRRFSSQTPLPVSTRRSGISRQCTRVLPGSLLQPLGAAAFGVWVVLFCFFFFPSP